MKRQLTVTVTLSGTCPEDWNIIESPKIKARAESVIEDTCRQVFGKHLSGLIVSATATVEGGDHE